MNPPFVLAPSWAACQGNEAAGAQFSQEDAASDVYLQELLVLIAGGAALDPEPEAAFPWQNADIRWFMYPAWVLQVLLNFCVNIYHV